jgi:hypothetical protein
MSWLSHTKHTFWPILNTNPVAITPPQPQPTSLRQIRDAIDFFTRHKTSDGNASHTYYVKASFGDDVASSANVALNALWETVTQLMLT